MEDQPTADRFRRIASALEDLVHEGEEFLVAGTDEGVFVSEKMTSPLEKTQPRLYGRLLSLDEQMQGSGLVTIGGFVLLGVFWMGLHAEWWESWLPARLAERMNVWWVFVILGVLVLTVAGIYEEWRARWVYRSTRTELFALLEEAGLDRDLLLLKIKDDDELSNIARQLKLDRRPPVASRDNKNN
jgi:hypothetical protein